VKRLASLLALVCVFPAAGAHAGGSPVALVTSETTNQLIAVSLPSGHVLRRLPMPPDPQNVEATPQTAVVVSTRGAAVTLVDVRSLRVVKTIRGFGAPHIPLIAADLHHAYVTDDARGQLVVIDLARRRVVRRVFVGYGAHHMAADSTGNQLWVALGERARRIVRLDVSDAARPRVVGSVDPHGLAHDLAFTPNGSRVWVTYDDRASVGIFSAATGRLLRRLPAGSPPGHVAFSASTGAPFAFVTSGNDGTLRLVSGRTGRTVRVVRTNYGSFNLAPYGSFVAISSLYRGTLMVFDEAGTLWFAERVAPAARDLAVTVP
jgi:DNA-binding beta-propeller fold protein YncE